jgi:branched-subunit amino acid ABC-type transport system permease component
VSVFLAVVPALVLGMSAGMILSVFALRTTYRLDELIELVKRPGNPIIIAACRRLITWAYAFRRREPGGVALRE